LGPKGPTSQHISEPSQSAQVPNARTNIRNPSGATSTLPLPPPRRRHHRLAAACGSAPPPGRYGNSRNHLPSFLPYTSSCARLNLLLLSLEPSLIPFPWSGGCGH
jgi:hypothetical protein